MIVKNNDINMSIKKAQTVEAIESWEYDGALSFLPSTTELTGLSISALAHDLGELVVNSC